MKHAKRFLALLLALVMVMGLAVSVSAVTITIDDDTVTSASYAAYKLLNAVNSAPEVGEDGKQVESKNFTYTMNEKYRTILVNVLVDMGELVSTEEDPATDAEIIAAIGKENLNTDTLVRTFADKVYAAIKAAAPAIDADYTATNNEFKDVAEGYYLIVETALGNTSTGATDTFSLVMLDTQGKVNITVTTKEGLPTVEKEVEEKDDSTGDTEWGKSADHDINDTVNFKIVGTVSDRYANYTSYRYQFTDTMEDGLTMNFASIKIYVVNGNEKTDVTNQFYRYETIDDQDTESSEDDRSNGFIAYTDLKVLDNNLDNVTITKDTQIVAEYSATLNEDALRGAQGNKNSVILYYENNPYTAIDPAFDPEKPPQDPPQDPPGQTPPDVTIIFTFVGDVNKVHKVNGQNVALPGAGFTLYKWYATSDTEGEWKAVGSEKLSANGGADFAWPGLDAGKYKLEESTVPAGYNKADDLIFTVVAVYNKETDPHSLTELKILDKDNQLISGSTTSQFTIDETKSTFTTDILNQAGTELPSTGGMGTTILYIAGGILVLAAIVLLVTKKRMASAE